jgi:hypothetical protein
MGGFTTSKWSQSRRVKFWRIHDDPPWWSAHPHAPLSLKKLSICACTFHPTQPILQVHWVAWSMAWSSASVASLATLLIAAPTHKTCGVVSAASDALRQLSNHSSIRTSPTDWSWLPRQPPPAPRPSFSMSPVTLPTHHHEFSRTIFGTHCATLAAKSLCPASATQKITNAVYCALSLCTTAHRTSASGPFFVDLVEPDKTQHIEFPRLRITSVRGCTRHLIKCTQHSM